MTVYTNVVYTFGYMKGVGRFDWDAGNVGHVLRHGITPFEVEETLDRPHLVIRAATVKGERRWKLFGRTASGRYLVVVFTARRQAFRAVTAYPMNAAERKKYASQII